MKTEWDYTSLADAYLKRPDYARGALAEIFAIAGVRCGDRVCDIGAGAAHLTLPLAQYGLVVDAVEPNDAMRAHGQRRTNSLATVSWHTGTGENTGRPSGKYDFVTFGSSFNVCDRQKALYETWRLLKPGKWFACLWNHRDLKDPVQAGIEKIITATIPRYAYGARREDQREIIAASGLFEDVRMVEGQIVWEQPVADVIAAWRSHATLQRQAGDKFTSVVAQIAAWLEARGTPAIRIPYTTRAWLARRSDQAESRPAR